MGNVVFTGGMAVLALTHSTWVPTNETIPPPPTPSPTPTPTPGGGCCKFGGACGDCGDDGTGWCHASASNFAVGTGTYDSGASAPSCSGGGNPSPSPSPSPSPPPSPTPPTTG